MDIPKAHRLAFIILICDADTEKKGILVPRGATPVSVLYDQATDAR